MENRSFKSLMLSGANAPDRGTMKIKLFSKRKVKKPIVVSIIVMCMMAISMFLFLWNFNWVKAAGDIIIEGDVSFNGKVYGKDNPFVILEVLPHLGLSEVSYQVRDTYWGKRSIQIPGIEEGKETGISEDALGPLTNTIGFKVIRVDNKIVYNNDLLMKAVFTEEEQKLLKGKILVKPVAANTLTQADIDDADLIYVNSGQHIENLTQFYNSYSQKPSCPTTSGRFVSFSDEVSGVSYDLSWKMAWAIYKATKVNGKPLIYDQKAYSVGSANLKSSNAYKLGFLIRCLPGDDFVKMYASTENPDGSLTGSEGCIISSTGAFTGVTYKNKQYTNYTSWTEDNEGGYMFVSKNWANAWEETVLAAHNYMLPGWAVDYLKENIFIFKGDNKLDMALTANSATDKSVGGVVMTDFHKVPGATNGNVLRYILGDFNNTTEVAIDSKINILEIEPTGEYTDFESALLALKYLGYSTNGYSANKEFATQNNLRYWKDYLNVTAISSNGFNGMNKDLIATYDLIIIGTNHTTLKTNYNNPDLLGKIYVSKGDTVTVSNGKTSTIQAKFSGNDLTAKAFHKIEAYVNAGMPLILSDDIYNSNTSVIDSDSKMFKLSKLGLNNNSKELINVVSISQGSNIHDSKGKLSRKNNIDNIFGRKPVVSVTSPLDTKITSLVNQFTGTIKGEPNTKYNIKIMIDKNSDGMFDDQSHDDANEVVNKTNNYSFTTGADGIAQYSVSTPMAGNARGYFGWNVIVTKDGSSIRGNKEGSFIIPGIEKIVKVLQIIPATADTIVTMDLSDDEFKTLFHNVHEKTNLTLQVNKKTTTEVEAWYDINSSKYKDDDMGNYSMIVIGYADDFGLDDLNAGALEALKRFNDEKKSILFTHDTMSYSASDVVTGVFAKSAAKDLTNGFRSIIGMKRFADETMDMGYSNMMLSKYANYSIFNNINKTTSMKTTNQVTKLNTGQVTQYPYEIPNMLSVATTHAQYYQLDLNEKLFNGTRVMSSEAVVWYTLSGDHNFYDQSGQDAVNNYYIYSIGNITYSGAGHNKEATSTEKELFVNTIIKAIASGNFVPEITIDKAAVSKKGEYIMNVNESDVDTLKVVFTATDNDLFLPVNQSDRTGGKLKAGKVYWDKNNNKICDENELLITYDNSNILYNGIKNEIKLSDFYAYTDTNLRTLKDYLQSNELVLRFEANDSVNAIGTASLLIITRRLFNLN